MKPKRSRHQITRDLLTIAKEGANITRLVYQGNMNFNTIHTYLKRMQHAHLIVKQRNHYHTTDKGTQYITNYNKLPTL